MPYVPVPKDLTKVKTKLRKDSQRCGLPVIM